MSTIQQYREFKKNLREFAEVPFDEFRGQVCRLRAQRTWSDDDIEYAKRLIDAGGAYALQRFCGPRHPAAAQLLGAADCQPDPMTKGELAGHMRALAASCAAAGWTQHRFTAFLRYLDSDTTPEQLREQERALLRRHAMEQQSMWGLARGADADADADEADAEDSGPKRDYFAEMYRSASPAFKQVVRTYMMTAAGVAAAATTFSE